MTASPTGAESEARLSSFTSLTTTTIDYSYDPLYRLTAADYSTGEYFHYTYDEVGNRLTQETHEVTNAYVYDIANRLIDVDAVPYTWDDNGNLLDDGERTYAFDHANHLTSVEMDSDTYNFAYNGLGDRLLQTVNGVPTNYTLDLTSGLTQVLSDETKAYLYGLGRIGEEQSSGWAYHMPDALGSVRQLTDNDVSVTLTLSYEPFGEVMHSSGKIHTTFHFTGEQKDETRLTYLRARYLNTGVGRFIGEDTILGSSKYPQTLNRYSYGINNPLTQIDPSGHNATTIVTLPPTIGGWVDFAKWTMSKRGLFNCSKIPDDGIASKHDLALDLFFDFLCERGEAIREFSAQDYLTNELSESVIVNRIRTEFYRLGGTLLGPMRYKFNYFEYSLAFLDLVYANVNETPVGVNITHFLGSFNTVKVVREEDRVRFTVENLTSRDSWTHIPGRFKPKYDLYLENLLEESPEMASKNLAWFILTNPVISILSPMRRAATSDYVNPPEGGGNMWQIFTWTESALDCGEWRIPWPFIIKYIEIE